VESTFPLVVQQQRRIFKLIAELVAVRC